MTKPQNHVWVIDGIEEGVARIEEDGNRILAVPQELLPSAAREGHVLSVVRDASDPHRASLVVSVDETATAAALERSRASTQAIASASRKRDPGGDVAL